MSAAAILPAAANTLVDSPSSRIPMRTLNQDDFLKLVIAQMTTQDPLNPQKDSDFVAQLTQFTTLEQTKGMQTDIAELRTQQQFLQANATLGRKVSVQDSNGVVTTGVVASIKVEAGTPLIVVNGQAHDLGELISIEPGSP